MISNVMLVCREARHPKIVEVIECITIQNQLAIVMEFMAGGNLKVFLGKGKRGQGKEFTLRFIEDIGSAVEHLHSQGFTHRDIKPENIFVSKSSFGLYILKGLFLGLFISLLFKYIISTKFSTTWGT